MKRHPEEKTGKRAATRSGTSRKAFDIIMEIAARQHGIVTRAQLTRAGLAHHIIDERVASGLLRPVHRGVFQVGPLSAPYASEMAAVLACGDGSVLHRTSAAWLWEVFRVQRPLLVEVGVPNHQVRRPGIRTRRVRLLAPDEVTQLHGMAVTTVARTLFDLGGVVRPRALERVLAEAERRRLTKRSEVVDLLARYPRRPGTRILRAILGDGGPSLTRSEAEERFERLVTRAGLRAPEANVSVYGHEVDFVWRAERLIVEIDGYAFHSSRDKFEDDRRRDALLGAKGFRVMRVTWRQLVNEHEAVIARLAQALVSGGRS